MWLSSVQAVESVEVLARMSCPASLSSTALFHGLAVLVAPFRWLCCTDMHMKEGIRLQPFTAALQTATDTLTKAGFARPLSCGQGALGARGVQWPKFAELLLRNFD